MFSKETIREISAVAKTLDIEPAALLAIAEVESAGKAYALVKGRKEPMIRFEGHYFDRRLSPDNRAKARAQKLSSPAAGGVPNPKTQEARWRMLERAAAIDRKAAYESVSWGLGQVMGTHWAWLGFANVEALVRQARSGVAGQTRLMERYIEKSGLVPAIRRHDWDAFARGYNGPDYKRHAYHTKIAAAYKRYRASETANATAASPSGGAPARSEISPTVALPGAAPAKTAQAGGWRAMLRKLANLLWRG
ncbi:N-acetylmuramidase family protein [Mesorhizobium sp. DCY119]|uniref:N-acetylmuramidase family protein n=1 Tax=Mesorhizobium sp. DCY119 TaxID=2108445 RepID=UPI000E6CA17B|nr:N-acetylmuramidase family protein [Mesorhizobium sp. DCY119]RJG44046.1 DUF3380 domain-containing protein [Mesorhizobium sp. DCY119]